MGNWLGFSPSICAACGMTAVFCGCPITSILNLKCLDLILLIAVASVCGFRILGVTFRLCILSTYN